MPPKTIPVQAPRTDTGAAEMASLIRREPTLEQKREMDYYAAPPEEDPETKNSRILLEILEEANKTNEKFELDRAIGAIMDFKGMYYASQSSKFRGKNAERLTELEKIIEDKMDDLGYADVSVTQWSHELSKWRNSSDSDYSSSDEEGAGASKDNNKGGRRRRRKSKKSKKKKKKKTRKKRKKRKTRKKRKLRKKKRRKTNRK